jgi:hypothetical protein
MSIPKWNKEYTMKITVVGYVPAGESKRATLSMIREDDIKEAVAGVTSYRKTESYDKKRKIVIEVTVVE